MQDLRLAFRLLAKSPGFAAIAIVVLALGIGVNTTMFSVVHALIFSARPYADPDRVMQLYSQDRKNPHAYRLFSYPTYRDLAARDDVFTGVLAHNLAMIGIGEAETSRRAFAAVVSSNYFDVLGVNLVRGRTFTPAEERPGAVERVAIASYAFWQKSRFDPNLIGQTVRVNERPFVIVGIAPKHFTGTMMLAGPELFFPLGVYDHLTNDFQAESRRSLERRDAHNLFVVARLRSDVTPEAAQEALRVLASGLEAEFPVEQKDQTFTLGPLPRLSTNTAPAKDGRLAVVGGFLLSMAGVVLLIACLNLANMLLARGAARRKEFAIRLALGGRRSQLVRQLLVEGLVLAVAGGAVGFVAAMASADLLIRSLSALVPFTLVFQGTAQPVIFGATLALCCAATLLFALGPALRSSRTDVLTDLKEQAGEDTGHRRRSPWLPRNPLVVVQIALSLALLTAGALFIRSALNVARIDTGLRADHTLIAEIDAGLGGYDETRALPMYRAIVERLGTVPGVEAASIAGTTPFGMITLSRPVQRAGLRPPPDAKPATAAEGLAFHARFNPVGADYFRTVGLPLLQGRVFTAAEADAAGAPLVCIIDEALARKLWPGSDPVGQSVQWATDDFPAPAGVSDSAAARSPHRTLEVVGVVPVVRTELFHPEPGPAIYVPFAQAYMSNVYVHVRGAATAPQAVQALTEIIRREIRATAPGVPLFSLRTFRQHLQASPEVWIVRTGAILFSIFGGLALLLAVVGIYGVKSHAVARRTREIGIRMALGARAGHVLRLILRDGVVMTLLGVGLGLSLSAALGQILKRMLFEVSAIDPLVFTVTPAVLIATALFACWLPARRATRVDPIQALRNE